MSVQVIDSCLPENILNDAYLNAIQLFNTDESKRFYKNYTNFNWSPQYRRDSAAILWRNLDYNEGVGADIRGWFEKLYNRNVLNITVQAMTSSSHHPWQNGNRAKIWLNPSWDPDWHGFLVYKNEENVYQAICPELNRCVMFSEITEFAQMPTSNHSDVLYSIDIEFMDHNQ